VCLCVQLTGLLLKKNVRLLWVLSAAARARLLPASLPSVVRVTSYVAQLSVLAHSAVRLAVMHATLTAAQVRPRPTPHATPHPPRPTPPALLRSALMQ
jgi:hypothetical protein